MSTKTWQRIFSFIVLAGLLLSLTRPGSVQARIPARIPAAPGAQAQTLAKIEPQVMDEIAAEGQTDFFVILKEQADLSAAETLKTKVLKGEYVYHTLQATADRSQKELRSYLDEQGAEYTPYYIANMILVSGGSQDLLMAVAARSDVASISANHAFQVEAEKPLLEAAGPQAPAAVESNLSFVNADDVWALGDTGEGTVLAGNDTGLTWDHPAIQPHYRGWDGANADHNYSWWSAAPGSYPYPIDNNGMGTFVTGIMVGDDGGENQIGMAPSAKTIHCSNTNSSGYSQDAWYIECFEWDLAPWDLDGYNPRPDLAPDAVNVSWNYTWGGGNNIFRTAVDNLQAAGILVEVSAGDSGSSCSTLFSPGDYQEVLTTGSVNHAGGVLPGTLSSFSSRGPSGLDGNYFPDVMAPGENVRSSTNSYYYATWSGTKMANPHATGLVGLMWSANPALRGMVEETMQIIKDTAVPLTGQHGSNCGGDSYEGPNNDWGYGTIDALAAVQMAIAFGNIGTLDGHVTNSANSDPIPGAHIQATLSITQSFQTATNALGDYAMRVISGTYTVEASGFGYLPEQATGIQVAKDQTTTQDFALDVAPSHVLSVTVVDANTGWPLYALTSLGGTPWDPVWNDPVTGHFEVTLPEGWVYTLGVDAWTPGYLHQNVQVGPLSSDTEVVIELEPDLEACNAPGYDFVPITIEDFEASSGGFTDSGYSSSWEWGIPSTGPGEAHSGSNVWATNLDGNYNDYEDSYLISPLIDLSGYAGEEIIVSWWQWLKTQIWNDYASVQVSNSGGAYWDWVYGEVSGDVDLNWAHHSFILDPSYAVSDFQMRFHLYTYDVYGSYPGWYVDDVGVQLNECEPMEGGLVVGNVYNVNEGLILEGATVKNDSGYSTQTAPTADPNVDDAFYVLFSPDGPHQFTASFEDYSPDVETVDVNTGGVVWQDFFLPAGHLVFDPLSMHVNLLMGSSTTEQLTISNAGTDTASFTIDEVNRGFNPVPINTTRTVIIPAASAEPPAGTEVALGPGYQPRPELAIQVLSAPANGPDVLIVCADYNLCEPIASQLLAFGDIGSVTSYDAMYSTPTLDELLEYDVVLTWNDYGYANAYGLGDVLADYVDAGGKVINLMFALAGGLQGRFVSENYTAMKGSGSSYMTQCLGVYDDSHPIMEGITDACDYYRLSGSYLTPGSTAVAYWTDGEIFVAAKDDGSVVSIGAYVGYYAAWYGQVDALVNNAVLFLAGASDVPWLSENPITGTVPVSSSQIVDVTFDAGGPEITQPGDYLAKLWINTDTPYPATTIPVTMTLTPPDTYGKLEGTVQSLGYCDLYPAPLGGVIVYIEGSTGKTWTLETDSNGYYQIWMDAANSPVTIHVTADEHTPGYAGGVVIEPYGAITTQDFILRWLKPCVTEMPPSLSVEVDIGDITNTMMTLFNTGAEATTFEIKEEDNGYFLATEAIHLPPSDGQFEHRPASTGPAPKADHPITANPPATIDIPALFGEPAFAIDHNNANLVYIPNTGDPGSWNIIGYVPYYFTGGDFLHGDFSGMYVMDSNANELYALDTATAAVEWIGSSPTYDGEYWTGLTGASNGVLYGSSDSCGNRSTLYTIDPSSGATSVIGEITNAPCIIDIAINADGEMYGVDVANDVLVKIDPATGAGTVIGSLGVDANYAQGLDFEEESGILYWASWNYSVWGGELRVIDTTTGNSASLGIFPGWDRVDCLAFTTGGFSDASWLSEDPTNGMLPADTGMQEVSVTFDSSVVPLPGTFHATLNVKTDDPINSMIYVPVTMIVNPTLDYGLLEGTVTGLGYCDENPVPIKSAEILIEAANGITYTVRSDENGDYSSWLKAADGPYIVSVAAIEHESQSVSGVVISSQETTAVDFELRWLKPCVSASPSPLVVDVALGYDKSVILDLLNDGASGSDFMITEKTGIPLGNGVEVTIPGTINPPPADSAVAAGPGYKSPSDLVITIPTSPTYGPNVLIVCADDYPCEPIASQLLAFGDISSVTSYDGRYGTPTLDELLAYDLVLTWNDYSYANAYGLGDVLADYVDAGGKVINLMFALNPWGLRGRFVSDNYTALKGSGNATYGACLGVYDTSHPIMDGITEACDYYRLSGSYLTPDSTAVAYWTDGEIFVAAKDDESVVSIAAYVGYWYQWYGQVDALVNNAVMFLAFPTDVPWLAEEPITGTIAHDSSFPLEVTFTAFPTMTVGGVYTASLIVRSDDPANPKVTVPVTMNVVEPMFDMDISADQTGDCPLGQVLMFNVTITNTSNGPSDIFTMSLSTSIWASALDVTEVGPLAVGESAVVHVSVSVPESVILPAQDTVQVTATSHGDPALSAASSLTTRAVGDFGVDLEPEVSGAAGNPGDVITYTLWLTNTGMMTDTITMTVSGAGASWATLPVDTFMLGAGETVDVVVVVTIPAGAAVGDYPVSVTATSMHDPTQTDDVEITTSVVQYSIYLPLIWKAP